MEVRLSGLEMEVWEKVVTLDFEEYEGKNAEQAAEAAARRMMRKLYVCEYGMSQIMEGEVLTIAGIERYVNKNYKAGWKEDLIESLAKRRKKFQLDQ
jgi:hypothetical protein